MSPMELFLLGRTLMKIGERALPTEGVPEYAVSVRTVMVVLADVLEHPRTSMSDVVARTGLPQSAVSAAVSRLKNAGSIAVTADPNDARRSELMVSKKAQKKTVINATIDDALGDALGAPTKKDLQKVVGLLEELAERLRREPKKQPKSRRAKA